MNKKKEVRLKNIKNFLVIEMSIDFFLAMTIYAIQGDLKKSLLINAIFIVAIFMDLFLANDFDEVHNKFRWQGTIFFILISLQIACQCTVYMQCWVNYKMLICGLLFVGGVGVGVFYYVRKAQKKITKFEKIVGCMLATFVLILGGMQKSMGKVMTGRMINSVIPSEHSSKFIWITFLVLEVLMAFVAGVLMAIDVEEKENKKR